MASLASINVKFSADLRGFSSEMQTALRQIDKAGQQFQKIGRSMSTFITLPILAAGAAAVKFASDYDESLNKVDVSFKSSSTQVKNFAKTTLESFGIAEGTALDLASAYGDMGTSMGLTTDAAATMSTALVGLAGDLSSFKNIGIEQANTAIAAVFTGETESLKKLGIVMTVANLQQFAYNSGLQTTIENMSQAEKVQLRFNYLLSVTQNSQGDFARTAGGAANQMRIFQESLKQVAQQLGAVVLPLFTKIITAINEKIVAFSKLSEGTKSTIVVIAGLVAVVGPLLLAIGAILSIIPAVVAGFALVSGAILPIIAAITLLYGAYVILKPAAEDASDAVSKLTASQKLSQAVTDEATSSIVDQKAQLESLLITARNENESKKDRLKAIQEINRISPEYLGNLTLENLGTDKARASIEKYNAALLAGATARAASRLLEQNQTDKIKAGFEREKALAEYNTGRDNAIAQGWQAEKQFYEDNNRQLQFANEALDRKNKKYDAEAKLLTDIYNKNKDNLNLLATGGGVADVAAPAKAAEGEKIFNNGTIAFYEQQIALLKTQQDEVSKTEQQYYLLGNAIAGIQEKINAISLNRIEPLNLQAIIPVDQFAQISSDFTLMQEEIAAKAGGMKASIDSVGIAAQQMYSTVASSALPALTDAFAQMGDGVVASLGLAQNGFQGFIGGLTSTITKLIAMMLASSISQSIAGAAASGTATGPAAVFTTPAFIATAVGGVIAAFAAIPKFETGGVVGGSSFYGDKILARVNSSELILNQGQQKKLYGTMNSGGNQGDFKVSTKLIGSDMLLLIERAQNRKNRIGS
jgi:hypothetical protein